MTQAKPNFKQHFNITNTQQLSASCSVKLKKHGAAGRDKSIAISRANLIQQTKKQIQEKQLQ